MAEDRAGDSWIPGGPSLYVSRVAHELGAHVSLLTHVPAGYDDIVFEGLNLLSAGERPAPRFDNRYDAAGNRTQRYLQDGPTISVADITRALEQASPHAVFVAPAMHEVPRLPRTSIPVFLSLQGYFRSVDHELNVLPDPNAWERIQQIVQAGHHTFWSVEDAGGEAETRAVVEHLVEAGVSTAVTLGDRGAWFPRHNYSHGECALHWRNALPVMALIDPTGAGDAFATAYCIRFLETGDEGEAERFALAAGSLAVERTGILAVPGRAAIETRAKQAGET